MTTYTIAAGVDTSLSTKLNTNFAEVTKVLATRLTSSAITSTSLVTLDTITLSNHGATTAYRFLGRFVGSGGAVNTALSFRIADGGTNSDSTSFDIGANYSDGTSYVIIDIYPVSSTQVVIQGMCWVDGNVPPATSYFGQMLTLTSSGTWVNQDTIAVRLLTDTGTLTITGYSFQRIGI